MVVPVYYHDANIITAMGSPGIVHCKNTDLVRYFKRYLYQKAISNIKTGIPKTWNRDYLLYTLFGIGYAAVINTNKYGPICQACGLYGQDLYYAPTHATIANPLLRGILRPRIHTQCVVLKLTPDYCGIDDLVSYYANKLALCGESVDVNLINTKLAYLFFADGKAAAASLKTLYDDVASGKPAVVADKSLLNDDGTFRVDMFNQQLRQTYIAGDVLTDMRKIEQEFLTMIGIPNANTEKRERLISDEVNANAVETQTLLDLWLDSLNAGADEANRMFGLNLSFSKRYQDDIIVGKEDPDDGQSESDD